MRLSIALFCMLWFSMLPACTSTPSTESERAVLNDQVQATIASFKDADPGIQEFFDTAHGYAVFPTVGKGGAGVGGARGTGEVYEQGELIGYCTLTQGTVGFQLGGQTYSELIFFERPAALQTFKSGDFEFAAQASAVAVTSGAAASAAYNNSVAVFTMPKGGLMFEASIGGQQFSFEPLRE